MIPEELFKRRHYGTPDSFFLTITNFVVMAIVIQIFALCNEINWYFWVAVALLALYNFYTIRRNRESYNKARIIGYVIGIIGLVLMFFLFRMGSPSC